MLSGFNILGELMPSFAGAPGRQVRLEDVLDLLERASDSFRVHEEDVDGHDKAEDAKDDVCAAGQYGV